MRHLFPFALLMVFLPISFETPIGYLSAVDFAVALMFLGGVCRILSGGSVNWSSTLPLILLSVGVYITVFYTTLISGAAYDLSSFVKYFIFLVFLPVAMVLLNPMPSGYYLGLKLHNIIAVMGAFLCGLIVMQIARGSYISASGDSYYVFLFNEYIHKNFLGSLLIFSSIGAAWSGFAQKKNIYFAIMILHMAVTLLLGTRSSFLVEMIFLVIIAVLNGVNKRTILTAVAGLVLMLIVGSFAYSTGIFSAQIDRLFALQSVDSGELTDASSRMLLWEYAWDLIKVQPLFGYGFGNFLYIGGNWLDGRIEPHNAILQIIYAVGFVGFFMFLLLLFYGLRRRKRNKDTLVIFLMLLGNIVNSMVAIIWVRGDGHLFWMLFYFLAVGAYSKASAAVPRSAVVQSAVGGLR